MAAHTTTNPSDERHALRAALEHTGHLLPDQGPLEVFVHHNTLHAFQDRPFHTGVAEGARVYGARPYMTQRAFQRLYWQGRITDEDLDTAFRFLPKEETRDAFVSLAGDAFTRRAVERLAMVHAVEPLPDHEIGFLIEEGLLFEVPEEDPGGHHARYAEQLTRDLRAKLERDGAEGVQAWLAGEAPPEQGARCLAALGLRADARSLATHLEQRGPQIGRLGLWRRCLRLAAAIRPTAPDPAPPRRHRDALLPLTGVDTDELVHPVLIRWTAAYVDQGLAYWSLPNRDAGFLRTWRELWRRAGGVLPAWLGGLHKELQAQGDLDAEAVALRCLRTLGVPAEQIGDYLEATLLALPGWAGMMHRLERKPRERGERVGPCTLVDWLAVRLTLEVLAARYALQRVEDLQQGWAQLRERAARPPQPPLSTRQRAHLLYQLLLGAALPLERAMALGPEEARELWQELERFDDLRRRRCWQEAYEHHHRGEILDALAVHRPAQLARPKAPSVQALFCIDEREESLRRALEERLPDIDTYGVAGFFGLAVNYRGVDDAHAVALCPVTVEPEHIIEEGVRASLGPALDKRRALRSRWARLAHTGWVGSRGLFRGWLFTVTLGWLALGPLALRLLFPKHARALRDWAARKLLPEAQTELLRHAEGDAPTGGVRRGLTLDEQVSRVEGILRNIGLTSDFARLVLVLGHGSSSLNNPHESAHDCGACGGGKGGPNARLFAAICNDPRVRDALARRGITIPDSTVFVGGMHDTATDAVDLYDLADVPASHAQELADLRRVLDEARALDAHERARRFEYARTDLEPRKALTHVQHRAEALDEPRPEYGHASNAICVVGRRSLTRGLYLDRRAFLQSYEPDQDPDGSILTGILSAVGPVCAGINLEYYFSYIDNERYGCGTKLPHNVSGLVGVMNGHASDLRTGLPWQMVEIHEPVRLLLIVEATPDRLMEAAAQQRELGELFFGRWVQLVSLDPDTGQMSVFDGTTFVPYEPRPVRLPCAASSLDYYRGRRDHLPPAEIVPPAQGDRSAA